MHQRHITWSAVLWLIWMAIGCSGVESSPTASSSRHAANIILFIGDGMGLEHRRAARWRSADVAGAMAMDNMPATGFLRTRSANNAITDSAASATAMATGVKTNNGVIGQDESRNALTTILELARSRGKRVGLVTSVHVTHATPAAFAAHIDDRHQMTAIAGQMLAAEVDVLLGGGEDEWLPTPETGCYQGRGKRRDGRNLINEARAAGYDYVCDANALNAVDPAVTSRLLGLFADGGLSPPFSPSLAEMTRTAIAILSVDPDGFFLMVEGGQIDWDSHANDAGGAISNTIGLDAAVAVAKAFAATSTSTLIIVAADHETGGMTLSPSSTNDPQEDGPFTTPSGGQFYVTWSSSGHTPIDVPVTAQGPGSDRVNGTHDNTHVYDVMVNAFQGRP